MTRLLDADALTEIARVTEAAYPGPWSVVQNPNGTAIYGPVYKQDPETGWSDKLMHLGHDYDFHAPHGLRDTAEFVALSRQAIPDLLAALTAKDEEIAHERWAYQQLVEADSAYQGRIESERDLARQQVEELTAQVNRLAFLMDQPKEGWVEWSERSRGGDSTLRPETYYTLHDTTKVWVTEARALLAQIETP